MSTDHVVPARSVPFLRKIYPDYRRRDVRIKPCTSVTFSDLNWSGGTRAEYALIRLDDKAVAHTSAWNQLAPWANPMEGTTVAMRPGFIVVRTGYACGKVAMLTIYVHPDNVAPLLTN